MRSSSPKHLALPATMQASFAARRWKTVAKRLGATLLPSDGSPMLRRLMPENLRQRATRRSAIIGYGTAEATAEATAELARKRHPAAILHIHDGDGAFFHAGVRTGGPLIAGFHLAPWELEAKQGLRRHWQKLARVLVANERQAMFFQNFVNPERIVLMPEPVDGARFNPDNERPRDVRHIVIPVTRHLDTALMESLLEMLFVRWPDLQLTALELERPLGFSHAAIRSIPAPSAAERRAAYTSCGALLHPVREAVGCAALLEAASCQCPLVLPTVGDVSDIFSAETALLVDAPPQRQRRATGLMDALEEALENPDAAAVRAQAGRAHILAEHDESAIAKRLADLLQSVTQNG